MSRSLLLLVVLLIVALYGAQATTETEFQAVPAPKVCPDGSRLQQVKQPTSNGCGSSDLEDFIPDSIMKNPTLAPCCDNHDYCYGTIGKNQGNCDQVFYTCMKARCSKLSILKRATCYTAAKTFFTLVDKFGSSAFASAQINNGCHSSDSEDDE